MLSKLFVQTEIPKWFKKSAIRRDALKQLYTVMNSGDEKAGVPLPFAKTYPTRWLVRGKIINNFLLNWEELQAYFACVEISGRSDARHKARMISSMLKDDINYLYLSFLWLVVAEFERVNATFEASSTDPDFLLRELITHYHPLKSRMHDEQGAPKPVSR